MQKNQPEAEFSFMKGVDNFNQSPQNGYWRNIRFTAIALLPFLTLLWSSITTAQVTQTSWDGWNYAETSTGEEFYAGAYLQRWLLRPKGNAGPTFRGVGTEIFYGVKLNPNFSLESRFFFDGGEDNINGSEAELRGGVSSLFRVNMSLFSNFYAHLLAGFTAYNFYIEDSSKGTEKFTHFRPSLGAGFSVQNAVFEPMWFQIEYVAHSAGGGEDQLGAINAGFELRFP